MNKVIFSALGVFLLRGFLAAEVPAPLFQPDTVVMVPLDSGQVAGQIPVWDGEQWVLVNPGIQGDKFRVDSVGSPSWETTGPTEGYDVGCLDPGACNYMPAAAISFPKMCDYLSCKGCTDEQYLEYSEQALIDDGSCETKLGCLDPNADNFEPEAEGTDGSCTYSGIALEYFGEEDVLPTNLLLFELITQAEDSLYDDIRFYVDGVLEQDTGRSMMWIAGYQPFEVHATALFEGSIRYSDTLLFDPYVSVSQVPVVFDVPIDPDTWLGEGISLVSTVDSLFVSYDEILEQSALELTCDFSSGPEFVVGTVADGDSAKWFSMTYLEAVDTLTISCAKTVTALTMLMPDLAKEEETILNFVEETIPTTTQFDSLVAACSSQIQNFGALSLSTLDYVHLNQTASELKAQLPEVALQSSACPGIGAGLFEWPTLMADDSQIFLGRALKYDNCGSDLSYAVQARSNLVGGGVRTSKTYVFGPELGLVGSLYWKVIGESLPSVVESVHKLIPADRVRLTPERLGLNPDAHAATSITVKTYGAGVNAVNPFVEDPALSGELIQGPLPPFSRGHDFMSHLLDAVVQLPDDCGLVYQLFGGDNNGDIGLIWASDIDLILASNLSDEEKKEAIRSYLLGQVLTVLKSVVTSGCGIKAIVKFLAWLAGVVVTEGGILVPSISAELYSYGLDVDYSQSYVTHQLVMGGQFLGTPILVNEGQFYESAASDIVVEPLPNGNYINVTGPDPYQESFSPDLVWGLGWHMPLLFSGSPGDEDQYTWPPLLENDRMDLLAYTPTIHFHPFVAYHQDGALLQLTKRNKIWAPGSGPLGYWPGSVGYSGVSPFSDFHRFHLQVSKYSSNFSQGQFHLWAREGTKDPPVSTVPGGLCWPIMGETYLQSQHVNVYDLYTPEVPRLDFEETQIPNYELNDPYWNGSDPAYEEFLGDVTFKYQQGVTVNGKFKELPDFPNRFKLTSDPMPLSSVVGLPLTVKQRVKGIKAFMEGNFTEASDYPLPYPGTTVFRDTVEASAAEFALKFSPSGAGAFLGTNRFEAPLFAELTGFPSGVVVSTVSTDGSDSTCWGCEVSQERVRVWLDESGRSPVDFKLDFSEVDDIGEDGLDVDLQVRLTTGCDGVLDVYEKKFHVQPNCQQNPFPCQGEEIVSFGGYNYDIVEIGCQCWFAENLRTTTYADGTAIPTEGSIWNPLTYVYGQGGNCYNYSPDIDACDENQSLAEYGRLYNWYAVNDASGLCPTGWHVPTGWEWLDLQQFLISEGFDGTEGTALKSASGWTLGGNGTDDFGFSGLPGGLAVNINNNVAGEQGIWWSSTINEVYGDGDAWYFRLLYNQPYSSVILNGNPIFGYSVRCLKDAD